MHVARLFVDAFSYDDYKSFYGSSLQYSVSAGAAEIYSTAVENNKVCSGIKNIYRNEDFILITCG